MKVTINGDVESYKDMSELFFELCKAIAFEGLEVRKGHNKRKNYYVASIGNSELECRIDGAAGESHDK